MKIGKCGPIGVGVITKPNKISIFLFLKLFLRYKRYKPQIGILIITIYCGIFCCLINKLPNLSCA
jgi:hypothetical protein